MACPRGKLHLRVEAGLGEGAFTPMKLRHVLSIVTFVCTLPVCVAADPSPVPLWPGRAPGETKVLPPEADMTTAKDNMVAGRRVIRLGNVAAPTITVYSPASGKNTGAAVLVCPGGGYSILALDLEGTEVCEWLNSLGVTAVLLKYRVPRRTGLEKHTAPLQDAQIGRAHV